METNKPNVKSTIIVCVALVILVGVFAIIYLTLVDKPVEGAKNITIDLVYADGNTETYKINTDAEYLRAAVDEAHPGLLQGDEGEFGLFIKTVNGVTIDESNQEWWCLTKSGEMVMTGIDMTPILDGDKYELTLTVGYDTAF